ncbi:MAG: branched-chain amino acid ABC transporter permease [Deltaproteobacteria bacterium]|nr:branched-chain amino acid ABC transporter permease [Deltaproteobacteria bacterium]
MDSAFFFTYFLQFVISGITIGSIYAMVAVGFNIIYNVTEIINFAQGEFVMLGGLIMVIFYNKLDLPILIAFLMTVIVVAMIGLLIDQIVIKSIKQPTVLTLIIGTIATSILLKGAAMFIWGKNPYDLPAFSGREAINFFGAVIQPQALWVIGILVVVVGLLSFFFEKSIIGKAMRACSDNQDAALLVGISVKRMILLSFALSAAIGAVAGVIVTPIALMEYDRGAMLAVKGFAALILGGLGSFPGAVIGGLLLGLIEALVAGYISSGYKDAFALAVLLILLFVRPHGILGNPTVAKFKKF